MRAREVRKSKPRLYLTPVQLLGPNHRTTAAQTVNFSIIGDSHVGYSNSLSILKSVLPKAIRPGSTRFVIFGGDNKHGSKGAQADNDYQAFKDAVTNMLGTSIPYKASIGNWENDTREQFQKYLNPVLGMSNFPGTGGKVKYVWLDNAPGKFSYASISLLRSLSANYYYPRMC
jgi:hypothetical protein